MRLTFSLFPLDSFISISRELHPFYERFMNVWKFIHILGGRSIVSRWQGDFDFKLFQSSLWNKRSELITVLWVETNSAKGLICSLHCINCEFNPNLWIYSSAWENYIFGASKWMQQFINEITSNNVLKNQQNKRKSIDCFVFHFTSLHVE